MKNPCFETTHHLTFFNSRFKTGQIAHWYYCEDCRKQSNWIKMEDIPLRYLETIDQWEFKAHIEGVPYLGREAKTLEDKIATLRATHEAHEKPEVPMPEPKPRAEAPLITPKVKTPDFDHGTGNPETEIQLLKRTIHNLTVHRDQLMVQNDRLQCELIPLRQLRSRVSRSSQTESRKGWRTVKS